MHLPSLKQLQYLVTVVELRHFGRAAEQCFVTQSTLSAGIQELEQLLGTQLLERTKRKVIPTESGEKIAHQARHLLMLASEMVESVKQSDEPLTGLLRLGVIPTIGPFLLPCVLPHIYADFPNLQLQLVEHPTANLLQALDQGKIDAAILAFPYAIPKMEKTIFWEENFLVCLPENHPLAKKKTLKSAEISPAELLLLEEGHCLTDHALSACHLESGKSTTSFAGTSLYTLIQMVLGKQGITFIPEIAIAANAIPDKGIKLIPIAESGPHRSLGVVWRKSYYKRDEMILLAEKMRSIMLQRS